MPVIIPSGGGLVLGPSIVGEYSTPAAPASGIIYSSVNERWDSVAYRMYGDPTQVSPLIQNNPGISIADMLDSGTQVFVPLITPATPTTTSTPWG